MGKTRTRIETTFVCPPIPSREHDWCATFSFFDGDDEQPRGWSWNEDDAVIDLLTSAAEFDDDGSCIEEVCDLAFDGWKASTKGEKT